MTVTSDNPPVSPDRPAFPRKFRGCVPVKG